MEIGMRPAGHIEKGVMFGRDGYLFLLDGGHHVFDLLLGLRKVTEQSYANFADNIARRAAICQRAGVGYVHVIYPDKHTVLTEQFPVKDPFRLAQSYLDKLSDIRKWVFFPRQSLQHLKPGAFLKTDTHLTETANILATGAIVQRLLGESQAEHVRRVFTSYDWGESDWTGDLGGRFEPKLSERQRVLRKRWPLKWFHNDMHGGNDGIVDVLFSPRAIYRKRIMVFGDSFSRNLASILSYFFVEVVFLRTRFFHDEMFEQIKPDLVITSNVERYLSRVDSDEARPPFLLYPYLNELSYAPSKAFAEAFTAVLSYGRSPYLDFLRRNDLKELHPAA
jgi:SGNH hydrolase-like domain, acetyltransferase AlgX